MKVFGTMYKKPCALVVGTTHSVLPQFGSLEDIVVDKEEAVFTVKLYETLYFSEHYHSYGVKLSSAVICVMQLDLKSHFPLHVRCIKGLTSGSQREIVMKAHISSL